MKKLGKNSLISICCLVPAVFLISFATSWQKDIPISVVGSSGVKPFSEALGDEYQKTRNDIDITVDAGGSGFGIEQVAKGFASIGNASKDPYSAVRGDEKTNHKSEWEKNRIKTVTIGWEAICIVFVPPQGLSDQVLNQIDKVLYVGNNNISEFYQSFSGWFWKDQAGGLNTYPTFKNFINKNVVTSPADISKLESTRITPYVRGGGAEASGTASSFYNKSHFADSKTLSPNQKKAFTDGIYGSDFKHVETAEANTQAYSVFKSNNTGPEKIFGSMVYLSSAFVESNLKEIKKNGYGIMGYSNDSGATVNEFNIENVQNEKYLWFRPLNSMISLPDVITEETKTPGMKFLYWILFGNNANPYNMENADDHDGKFKEMGGIPLNKVQFLSMCLEKTDTSLIPFWTNFWTSDVTLAIKDGNWSDGLSFGAAEK